MLPFTRFVRIIDETPFVVLESLNDLVLPDLKVLED
jgi:hypothetical protein